MNEDRADGAVGLAELSWAEIRPSLPSQSVIDVREPFPWKAMLSYLRGRSIPGRELVDEDRYFRIANDATAVVAVSYDPQQSALVIDRSEQIDAGIAEARVIHLFSPSHDADLIRSLHRDPVLGPRIAGAPGIRPLGCWDPFELCVRTILGQQVSVKAAQSLMERVAARCAAFTAEHLARADLDAIGMPGRRVAALQKFAKSVDAGSIDLSAPWPRLKTALAALPGFGPWTCEYLGIRLARDADAFPSGDAGLIRAARVADAEALECLAESWRPHRALGAAYLWMVEPPELN
jgi:3-methyladenine DNA glycosylase/8-oxoguanine DNA glycosylase